MASWVTPAGLLGEYVQGKPMAKQLVATSATSVVSYEVAKGSSLPPGLSLNKTTGIISGKPSYVYSNTSYSFEINAIDSDQPPSPRTFSITVTNLVWVTPPGSIGVYVENSPLSYTLSATPSSPGNTVKFTLLNGNLPAGTVTLSESGVISGIPSQVNQDTVNGFTVRATEYVGSSSVVSTLSDRTFSITISGETVPQFTDIITNGTIATLNDSTWFQYQMGYSNPDPGTTASVRVVIGILPPGLEINSKGVIQGYALPPTGLPPSVTSKRYDFTLEVSSASGSSLANYNIIVVNQALLPDFSGRVPALYNIHPPTFVIPENDPYSDYYITDNNMGSFIQADNIVFKFIGHNFDTGSEAGLEYQILGSLVGNPGTAAIYQTPTERDNTTNTGWLAGVVNMDPKVVATYNFTVRVINIAYPTKYIDALMSVEITNGEDITVDWLSPSDLGTIKNGTISDFSVLAESRSSLSNPLRYRLISKEISRNLKTIVVAGTTYQAFGEDGEYASSEDGGATWVNQLSLNAAYVSRNILSAVYDGVDTILVGGSGQNSSFIGKLDSAGFLIQPTSVPNDLAILSYVILGPLGTPKYIAIGATQSGGGCVISSDNFTDWTSKATVSSQLNGICFVAGKYVAVGNAGKIFTSTDLITWTPQLSPVTTNLSSVAWTGSRYVAVGVGAILTSPNAVNWTKLDGFSSTYKSVVVHSNEVVVVGINGIILKATEGSTLLQWQTVANSVTQNTLCDVIYVASAGAYFIAGDQGTILKLTPTYLSSPTLSVLPPNLSLLPSGRIVGRLAFESIDVVVPKGTTKTYEITIQAYSPYFTEIRSEKTFTITTYQEFAFPYDDVYMKLLGSYEDRAAVDKLLHTSSVINPQFLYRPDDIYFGKPDNLYFQHTFGIPSVATELFYEKYIEAVQKNFYWRNVTLGEMAVAVARDNANNIIYEVVYSRVLDDLVTPPDWYSPDRKTISKEVFWPRNIVLDNSDLWTSSTDIDTDDTYYDANPLVKNLAQTSTSATLVLNNVNGITIGMNLTGDNVLKNGDLPPVVVSINPLLNSVTLDTAQSLAASSQVLFNTPIDTSAQGQIINTLYPNSMPNMRAQLYYALGQVNNRSVLPRWMTSQQLNGDVFGYIPAVVLCYVKPGFGEQTVIDIKTKWNYKLNEINFELDRFEVDRSMTYDYRGQILGWPTLPSAQPLPTPSTAEDKYVYFPQQTILPGVSAS